ncbi:MAG: histidinol-phosphate transaminase [Bacteroidetes bacterium]|nr:histidinol-phosphate transaminase [Bacteroidota bacterium]
MSNFDFQKLIRPHLKDFQAYSSARSEFRGKADIFLDATENPYQSVGGGYFNRYPDSSNIEIRTKIAAHRKVEPNQVMVGNGSDEVIDLLFRAFCEPKEDKILICPPTYPMFKTSAILNNVGTTEVLLTPNFQLDTPNILNAIDDKTKIIFLNSPNNPTGNLLNSDDIKKILNSFNGLVVLDEAYIDFADSNSWVSQLDNYPNLFIIQTMSKAWGMAGLRLGLGFGNAEIINILQKIKPPYNINSVSINWALKAFDLIGEKYQMVELIRSERIKLSSLLSTLPYVKKVYDSDSNFVLVKVTEPDRLYNYLLEKGIVVRNRNKLPLCEGCLRICVGNSDENKALAKALKAFE